VFLASDKLKDAARAWIDKLSVKNGTYPPDSYPNPGNWSRSLPDVSSICSLFLCIALAYHNAQLQASAFREEFDVEAFEDMTEPNIEKIHKVMNALYHITSASHVLSSASR
jgi:ATP-dependent DNA helicase 2 subunit 1